MNKKNRIILLAAMLVAAVSQTFAQGNGLAGINEATSMVTSYFDPGTKLIYAIGAVVVSSEASRCMASSRQATQTRARLPQAGSEPASFSS